MLAVYSKFPFPCYKESRLTGANKLLRFIAILPLVFSSALVRNACNVWIHMQPPVHLRHRLTHIPAPKRPYFAQDSNGYITSRNDIPLLSLVTPSPLLFHPSCPSFLGDVPGHEASLFPSFGNSRLHNYHICPLFFCHAVTCRHIFWRHHFPTVLAEYIPDQVSKSPPA